MASNATTAKFRLDLRSPVSTKFRRGLQVVSLRVFTLVLLDIIAIYLAWELAVSHGTAFRSPWTELGSPFILPIEAVGIGVIASRKLYKAGAYRRDYLSLIKAVSLLSLLLLLLAFLYEPGRYVSRSTFLLFWFLTSCFICFGRYCFDKSIALARQRGVFRSPTFLISEPEMCEKSLGLIEQEQCYNIRGVADPSALDRDNRDATFDSLRRLGVVEVFVSWHAIKNRLHLCWRFHTAGITLRVLPTDLDSSMPKSELWLISGVPCFSIPAPMIIGGGYWLKRYFDFLGAIVFLICLSPLYLLITILIKLDSPGPIFFRQTRVGLHGRRFKVWKFRTMVANADKLQSTLESKNETKDGVLFKIKDDPRITRVGKFLRRYSLDELPQVFNVLFGEMSFVGPRPLPIRDVERFKERHFIRQEVLPGITGLWQVSGRSNIKTFEDVVDLDLFYIANWSFWLDVKIMLRTVGVVLHKTGAY